MVFNSFGFLIFFPIFLILYRVLPLKVRWVMMLILSYLFYMGWQADLIYLILFTTLTSYVCAILTEKFEGRRKMQRLFTITAVVVSLAVLFFFKYFNFVSENVAGLLGIFGKETSPLVLDLILPVGISFYTFQTLSYVIDVYRGRLKAERHFGYYALYVSFFPQLVAGPIERPENLIPQLKAKNPFNVNDTAMGLKFMLVGFFKKIVIADQIAKCVDAVYNNVTTTPEVINGFTVAVATVLFAIQIYCDFSGYTDIAIGCSRILGIRLMQNFNDPYSATNIKDFWRRWHISLTSWFTDYVYIPLGGSRCAKWRHLLNIFIVFLLSGIWHGAAWTYILWGVVHGIYQIVGNLIAKPKAALLERLKLSEKSVGVVIYRKAMTFILVCLAWMVFRANSISDLGALFIALFSGTGIGVSASVEAMGLSLVKILSIICSVVILKQLDLQINTRPNYEGNKLSLSASRSSVYIVLVWAVAVAWMILLVSGAESSFIYFQF